MTAVKAQFFRESLRATLFNKIGKKYKLNQPREFNAGLTTFYDSRSQSILTLIKRCQEKTLEMTAKWTLWGSDESISLVVYSGNCQ
jgi:hypothetical protein